MDVVAGMHEGPAGLLARLDTGASSPRRASNPATRALAYAFGATREGLRVTRATIVMQTACICMYLYVGTYVLHVLRVRHLAGAFLACSICGLA